MTSSPDTGSIFSLRIVSLDHYMSPPIPDLDLCYSDLQGREVQQVPVIRIFGSTPAGQKACLHIHRALPYLYVPCPDDLLHSPEEGHAYLHHLSCAVEKALSHKGTASKIQHVHGCSLVRAKKFYGYHASEDLFIKIYLYYPHEVSRAANLLLSGDILNRSFQPYESHIPYLLQFMVDYNLYGMSHIRTSKFKFRPPLLDGIIPRDACCKNHDMAHSSSGAAGSPVVWRSSSIPSAFVWSDSATLHDDLHDKKSLLISRQSVCELELDSSIDDIQNEKHKVYTSLSQTGSDVKMVQSLIPIWEEESERSGLQTEVKSPKISKLPPEDVLKTFEHGLEYEKFISLLCLESQNTSSLEVPSVGVEDKLDKYIKSFTDIGSQRLIGSFDKSLKYSEEQCKDVSNDQPLPGKTKYESFGLTSGGMIPLSETLGTREPKNLDIEALGLLSWLASSQAVEDLNIDGELAHEAILSPLMRSNSYKKAMEQVHLDYENASQQECQDILDSVEVPKIEELRELGYVADSQENMLIVSSGNIIQQVDGSSDENFRTPQEEDDSTDGDLKSGKSNSSIHHVGKCTGKRYKKKKPLWGSLPLSKYEKEHDGLENPANLNSLFDVEMRNDNDFSSPSGSKERYVGVSDTFDRVEASGKKDGKISDCSVRDLMRRKRHSCTGQPGFERFLVNTTEEELKDKTMRHQKEPIHQPLKRGTNIEPMEPFLVNLHVCQDGLVQESMIDSEMTIQGDHLGSAGQSSMQHVGTPTRSKNVSIIGQFLDESVKSKSVKSKGTGHQCIALCNDFSGRIDAIKSGDSHCYINYDTRDKIDMMAGYQVSASCAHPKDNVDNFDKCSKSCNYGDQTVTECLRLNDVFASNSLTDGFTQLAYPHDGSKYTSDMANGISQVQFCETVISGDLELHSASDVNRPIQNHTSGELDMGKSLFHSQFTASENIQQEKGSIEYFEMTFSRKPPSRDEVGGLSPGFPGTSGHFDGTGLCDEALAVDYSFVHSNGQHMTDVLPFFAKNYEGEKSSNYSLNVENLSFPQEFALGVPSHFLNDGSVLYLLTHALSPPSLNCVEQWVSEMVRSNGSKDSIGACNKKIPSPPSSLDSSLKTTGCYETPLESTSVPDVIPEELLIPEFRRSVEVVDHCSHTESQVVVPQIKENTVHSSWQVASQISGPDAKSILTPLSQIGFRDPASFGAGQQLTLISIEILAESRGDLRPDPQFDCINIISLGIREDTCQTFEVYVLICGNEEEICKRNLDGISDCNLIVLLEERQLLDYFVKIIVTFDPDVIMGWEIQRSSLGFLAERAAYLGIGLLNKISRTPQNENRCKVRDPSYHVPESLNEPSVTDNFVDADAIISDEWGRSHASGVHVGGRIVLNVWRLMRAEIKLSMYTLEAVSEEVLRRKIPSIPLRILSNWFSSGPARARYRCIKYIIERVKLNIQIMDQLDMINRTSELARVFGIDFFSVLSRGSQFRVESMLLRLAHTQNYLAISPGSQQVASQPAMECLPLVMEPESGFYVDPVIVLDFQSLYPSMIIAYNLCYSTCLGKVDPSKESVLGVTSYSADPQILKDLSEQILLTPNGVMYVPSKVRKGVLPRLLEEILSTRIMVKQAMKKLKPSQQVLHRIFNARQLALKLISNVTYGYTAAGFSGRMPCAELADSIVQCGRRTLETAISFVNQHDIWKAQVIYGDTDSMFVLLKGRTLEEAFRIGNEIASSVTAMNPHPVTLKMEKVYQPCFLLTKKRYVGYSYESPDQKEPKFDAKGIETVRRDTCPVVAKTLEQSLRLMFEHRDISKIKSYLHRQWTRILSGKYSLQDFIFAKEVRLGTYRAEASSLPPAAIVAMKAIRVDPRAEPHYGERVPYVVTHGEPGAHLIDLVIDPHDLLHVNSHYRLNDIYYINKQIIPALQRVFGLLGADLYQWFSEMPRPFRPILSKRHNSRSLHEYSRTAQVKRNRIDTYYASKHCALCGELVQDSSYLCINCSKKQSLVAAVVTGRTARLEREIQHLTAICRHCGGGDWIIESGVKCTSLACSVFYERRKVQKELQVVANVATDAGFYPTCMAEWF